ncbi:MAG: rhodanese-like domain-containing protein [Pirellulales bacterium]|nr:rhodanese-like domain-containing protein [Pirellulales bacterium]
MMKQFLISAVIGVSIFSTPVAWSYDVELAESYEKLFSPVAGEKAGKALHFVKPDAFVEDIKAGKKIVAIDVRTPSETSVFTLSLPNSLVIPANEIFKKENLARIPTDKPVMVICKSGARATALGTALRHIGFDNVYILKGGFQALSSYYGPKEAYQ